MALDMHWQGQETSLPIDSSSACKHNIGNLVVLLVSFQTTICSQAAFHPILCYFKQLHITILI